MTKSVFIDSSGFIALVDKVDKRYTRAKELYETIKNEHAAIYTSVTVLSEVITRARYKLGTKVAQTLLQFILKEEKYGFLTILWIEKAELKIIGQIMKKFPLIELSFTDAHIYWLMKRYKISAIFSFDSDFVKMGLKVLS